MKYLLLFLFSFDLLATQLQRDRQNLITPKPPQSVSTSDVESFPEIYLHNNSVLQERNAETGLYSTAYFTAKDESKFSASYMFSQDYEDFTKVSSFDLNYQNKFDNDWEQMWWGILLKRTIAKNDAIAEDSIAKNGEPRSSNQQSFTTLGFGYGHRFKTLSSFLETQRVFETVSVYVNYVFHIDSTDSQRYQGFGYNADYGLHYRSSESLFYGLKMSYNWAQVERAAENNEKLSDRSIVFGWFQLGFEIGYYF